MFHDIRDIGNGHQYSEIDFILFDSSITKDEIVNSITRLNINKTASGRLLGKHIFYGLAIILPLFVQVVEQVVHNRRVSRGLDTIGYYACTLKGQCF